MDNMDVDAAAHESTSSVQPEDLIDEEELGEEDAEADEEAEEEEAWMASFRVIDGVLVMAEDTERYSSGPSI